MAELYYDITNQTLMPDDLTEYTGDALVATQLKNDVSFKTNDKRYIKEEKLIPKLYQSRPVAIPAAEIYVAYNGEKPLDKTILKLSTIGEIKKMAALM